ncbi:MAG: tRNA(His) guanylyltransferase Thg1 family protein [Lachnospiraceae bacterium]|nr:tRNA(His) guanylyltransferase Thg1 family protein [Lachnospiraceae bacterium]
MKYDKLGSRMKSFYEEIPRTRLIRRIPVAIHLDGRSFHTFTKNFEKPFDKVLHTAMNLTTKHLCENIQGCVLGYTQSDEITLILIDLNTDAWFNYEVQKMCSISASMATFAFNRIFGEMVSRYHEPSDIPVTPAHLEACKKGATFDSRCFNIPREEVTNLIYWRQQDAIRNSVQQVAQAYFPHSQLLNKNILQVKDLLLKEKRISWNDFPIQYQRGVCCIKDSNGWHLDTSIPVFIGENRKYIECLIKPEEE